MRLHAGAATSRSHQAFESVDGGPNDTLSAQSLAGEVDEDDRLVVFERARDEPRRETVQVRPIRATQAEVRLRLKRVVDPRVSALPVLGEVAGLRVDLLGDVLKGRGRDGAAQVGQLALQGLEGWFMGFVGSPLLFTLILIGFILLVGTVIETIPAFVVLAPTLIKVCVAAGFHEIQAALVLVVGFIMGAVTPPVGIVYFTAAFIAEEPLEKVAVALIPFMLVEVLVMFLILYFPALTLWLPKVAKFI